MSEIKIDHNPSEKTLADLGANSWPIWEKEVSKFEWYYDQQEVCYFLEGDVEVTPVSVSHASLAKPVHFGEPVRFGKGDLVTFPKGMSCTWKVLKPVRKHYKFG